MIGDTDPEDAWDASDPIPVRLENIIVRLAVLERLPADLPRRVHLIRRHLEQIAGELGG